jgi:hypothetical protein
VKRFLNIGPQGFFLFGRHFKILHLSVYNRGNLIAPLIYRKQPESDVINSVVIFLDLLPLAGKRMQLVTAIRLYKKQHTQPQNKEDMR